MHKNDIKKILVCLPVYNEARLLKRAVNSILEQTYKNFSLVIINDGSTDNSYRKVEDFIQSDIRFKLFKRDYGLKGAGSCRNFGLNLASGKYIIFLDSDDILHEDCLYERFKFMESNIGIDF
jgi:glycosyltransferase involved in cell wall biosynthesis